MSDHAAPHAGRARARRAAPPRTPHATTTDSPEKVFLAERDALFAVAYRMLGSVAEAEDVVQQAYLRWAAAPRDDVERPGAWLTAVTTRLCVDRLRSAQHRREAYVGPWLPEPLVTAADDPATTVELSDSLTTAFLVLLERLNPVERAAFLLHDVFGFGFDEIGSILERPASSCRQLASRARQRVTAERRPHAPVDHGEERRLVTAFLRACEAGDVDTLVSLLAQDAVLWSDGGTQLHAARRPVTGARRVARFCGNVGKRLPPADDVAFVRIGDDPAVVFSSGGRPFMTIAFELDGAAIRCLHAVTNPEKLAHLAPREPGD